MSSKVEIAQNAIRWAEAAKRDLPRDIGCVFLFFPKDAVGTDAGVVVGNVNNRRLIDELKSVVGKLERSHSPIILPGDAS